MIIRADRRSAGPPKGAFSTSLLNPVGKIPPKTQTWAGIIHVLFTRPFFSIFWIDRPVQTGAEAGCGRDAVPLAVEWWYNFPEFGRHLGNVGLYPFA